MTGLDTADLAALDAVAAVIGRHPDFRVLRRVPFMPILPGAPDDIRATCKKAVVVDSETTGLDTRTDKAVEFGAAQIWYDESGVRGLGWCKDWLEDPGIPISAEATAIHGLTNEMVAGKRFDDEEIERTCRESDLVIAHNAAFDRPIVERRFPWFAEKNWACSVDEVPWKEYGCPSKALQVIAWANGMFFDAHRTRGDTSALAYMLGMIRLGDRSPFTDLLASARTPLFKVTARGTDYSVNETLKARGYRWNPGKKGWWIACKSEEKAKVEFDWLRDHILRGKEPEWSLVKAVDRYTARAE